jgi:hypothetical protein
MSRAPWGSRTGCSKSCRYVKDLELGFAINLDMYPSVLCLTMRLLKYLVLQFIFSLNGTSGGMLLQLWSRILCYGSFFCPSCLLLCRFVIVGIPTGVRSLVGSWA